MLDAREDGHCIASILTTFIEIMIVKARFGGTEDGQYTLDAERASHIWKIVITGTKGSEQVIYILMNIQ